MATRPKSDFKILLGLKKSMARVSEDIRFLKQCLENKITPKSHRINMCTSLHKAQNQKMKIERELIKNSIKGLYKKLNDVTLKTYSAHLKLAGKEEQQNGLYETLAKIQRGHECEKERKRRIQGKKIKELIKRTHDKGVVELKKKGMVQEIKDFVVNQSTQNFTQEQLSLLNRGLNFAIEATRPPKEDIIADMESGIRRIPQAEKEEIRRYTAEALKGIRNKNARASEQNRIVKELREKPVYYIKADKGNAVVIMDKCDYDRRVMKKIEEGNFKELKKDPLPETIKRVEKALKECKQIIGESTGRLRMPNPSLPRIKCLPKIHKEGEEMREIITATNSPTQKIAKWLLEEFLSMKKPVRTRSIKNHQEFISIAKEIKDLGNDDLLISFDVKALFPSIPVKEALKYLEEWLMEQESTPKWKTRVKQYVRLAELCMEENYFMFRDKYYKGTKGVTMGNPLSGFISEIFMARMEQRLEEEQKLPRIWMRYVDDVFAVVDKEEVEETFRELNGIHKDIRFTMEVEEGGELPFLELLVRRAGQELEFGIYRKPSSTQRFIPRDSNHPIQHKMAAYKNMIWRMYNIPMKKNDWEKERDYIIDTAWKNGYEITTIKRMMRKEEKKRTRNEYTTLYGQNQEEDKIRRIGVTYHRDFTPRLKKKLKAAKIEMAPSSRTYQLKSILGTTKDRRKLEERNGVYRIECRECGKIYIGQTKRLIKTRFLEHVKEAAKWKKNKGKGNIHSAVAKHMVEEGHKIHMNDVTILKETDQIWKLEAWESIKIAKECEGNLMNEDKGNAHSWLMDLE